MRRLLFLLLLVLTLAASAQEVQRHGLVFEQWVRTTFFAGYAPPVYTQQWDIPAAANANHGGLPVNPKAVKYGTAVDLGDALRQHAIDEPFILVLGFWQQEGGAKRFVHILPVTVTPEQWRRLWGPITRADLERLDAVIKDRSLDYREARQRAQALKRLPPFNRSIIVLNPKIDAKTQRRLQCSIRFRDVFKHLAPDADPAPQAHPQLWGVAFPGPITSPPRNRN